MNEDLKEKIIDSLDYGHYPYFKLEGELFSNEDRQQLKQLPDELLVKLGILGKLVSEFLPKRKPDQQQRVQSLYLMFACFGLWTFWKLSGYVLVSPVLCVLGFFIGICFFIASYLLSIGDKRFMKKEFEKLEEKEKCYEKTH